MTTCTGVFECSQAVSAADEIALSALWLAYFSSYSACACITDETQMAYDMRLDSFRSVFRHARVLIDSIHLDTSNKQDDSHSLTANFTFGTAIVPALFYAVIRCRCPAIRREAIELLGKHLPWEGLWDPEQYRIVAERVVDIEEAELDARGWPTQASRLYQSIVSTEVDEKDGFVVDFLYNRDLNHAAESVWSERLVLGESPRKTLPLR